MFPPPSSTWLLFSFLLAGVNFLKQFFNFYYFILGCVCVYTREGRERECEDVNVALCLPQSICGGQRPTLGSVLIVTCLIPGLCFLMVCPGWLVCKLWGFSRVSLLSPHRGAGLQMFFSMSGFYVDFRDSNSDPHICV